MISPLLIKFGPPWFVLGLFAYWCATYSPSALAAVGLAATGELILWFNRVARAQAAKNAATGQAGGLERALLSHPLAVCVGLVVFGVLVNIARVAYALGAFVAWFVVVPAVMVNRQRYQRAKALRLAATAQAVIDHARTESHVLAGAKMQAQAHEVLARPMGLEESPPPPAIEAAPARALEAAPVLELEAEAPANIAVIHGMVTTWANGRHQFDPLGGES